MCICLEETSIEEEECLALLYPWQCYSDNLKVFEEFSSLEALCQSKRLMIHDVIHAVIHHNGNFESYHIVKR